MNITTANPGWYSKVISEDGSIEYEPVAVWMETHVENARVVIGLIGTDIGLEHQEDASGFAGYVYMPDYQYQTPQG